MSEAKVFLIGLDGVPHSLLLDLTHKGVMPNLADLFNKIPPKAMTVTLPEISSVSWSSFMTGSGPGVHGIHGFIDLKPGTREFFFPEFRHLKKEPFWSRLGKKGKISVVLNQPATYPALPMQGVLVSGFVAVDLRKAVYPLRYYRELESRKYLLDIDTEKSRSDPEFLYQQLDLELESKREAGEFFWHEINWDYLQLVITGTDRLQHFQWEAIVDDHHPQHEKALAYYQRVDEIIGIFIEKFEKLVGKERALKNLLLLSDHGFTGIKKCFNLNYWLEEQGYLSYKKGAVPSLKSISASTCAFAIDPTRIYLNTCSRFTEGIVDQQRKESLQEELIAGLLELKDGGVPVIQKVLKGPEVNPGPEAVHGPDLLVITEPGYDCKGGFGATKVFTMTDLQGMHTWNNAFLWASEPLQDMPCITEVAPIIERLLSPDSTV